MALLKTKLNGQAGQPTRTKPIRQSVGQKYELNEAFRSIVKGGKS